MENPEIWRQIAVSKWTSKTIIVDVDTGEILRENWSENGYRTIKVEKNTEYEVKIINKTYVKYGHRSNTRLVRHNGQQKLW